jgi:putative transcriptional regulator
MMLIFSQIKFARQLELNMNRIKEVLEESGTKQTWLAEKLGKSYNMVNSYVRNKRQPSIETLFSIAEILGVSVRELLIDNKEK